MKHLLIGLTIILSWNYSTGQIKASKVDTINDIRYLIRELPFQYLEGDNKFIYGRDHNDMSMDLNINNLIFDVENNTIVVECAISKKNGNELPPVQACVVLGEPIKKEGELMMIQIVEVVEIGEKTNFSFKFSRENFCKRIIIIYHLGFSPIQLVLGREFCSISGVE